MAPRYPLLWHHIPCPFSSCFVACFAGLQDLAVGQENIGLKRMGELDLEAFGINCRKMPSKKDAEATCLLCSKWENEIKDSSWHPFVVRVVDGKETVLP